MSCYHSNTASLVLFQRSSHAFMLATAATSAFESGIHKWSVALHDAAERCHSSVLAGVAILSDDEADLLEPAVTKLERELYHLRVAVKASATTAKCDRRSIHGPDCRSAATG
jgi:hypothetical protein